MPPIPTNTTERDDHGSCLAALGAILVVLVAGVALVLFVLALYGGR